MTGDSVATDDTRVLQDLSVTDAEELQAFVDKRKWFEVKLQASHLHAQELVPDLTPEGARKLCANLPVHSHKPEVGRASTRHARYRFRVRATL